MRDKLGICQWFHYEAVDDLERCVSLMHELGLRHLRTGISWADFYRPGGQAWYDAQMAALEDFDVLLSVWHTPPSIAEGPACNAPPKDLKAYADFIDLLIDRYGDRFGSLELWNEPNNKYKWDFRGYDPRWSKFSKMVGMAAHWAKKRGRHTVLGGMIPVDPSWLALQRKRGVLDSIDVVAIHAFPQMWWPDRPSWDQPDGWRGWEEKIAGIAAESERPIWVTETGLATCDPADGSPARLEEQVAALREASEAPVERIYWYCLRDLDPDREAIEGFHVDENEYHLGLVTYEGERKPAFYEMQRLLAR